MASMAYGSLSDSEPVLLATFYYYVFFFLDLYYFGYYWRWAMSWATHDMACVRTV